MVALGPLRDSWRPEWGWGLEAGTWEGGVLRTGTLGLPGLQARRQRGSRHQVRRHLRTGVWGPQATAVEEGGLVQDWERTSGKRTQASACRGQAGRCQRGKQPTLARGLKGPRHSRLTPEGPDSWAPLQPHRRAGVDSALVGSAAAEAGNLSPNPPPERLAPRDKGCWHPCSPGCSQEGWSGRGPRTPDGPRARRKAKTL